MRRPALLLLLALGVPAGCMVARRPQPETAVRLVAVGDGWARSSVNAVIFRSHSLVTHDRTQYIAWYDGEGSMLLGKRRLDSDHWEIRPTRYTGNVRDAHNAISIAVDGRGVLHVAWDHHGQPLNYARGIAWAELTDRPEPTGDREDEATTPVQCLCRTAAVAAVPPGLAGRCAAQPLGCRSHLARGSAPMIGGEGAAHTEPGGGRPGAVHVSLVWRAPDVAP
jgi:hypothetical protein